MKATGIVRRIDDLGRIVIPKEIRRVLRIREGDPLEIFTEKDGEVIFKKYSLMGELSGCAEQICESLHKTSGMTAAICDRDNVIAASGTGKRDLLEKHISAALEQVMEDRGLYSGGENAAPLPVLEEDDHMAISVAALILSAGDVIGCVLFVAERETAASHGGELEQKLAQMVAGFLGRQMEN
ncbi:MAG: AbrB/MazE/SpoVT family DNA-binding domain-containing protein [Oscillospiraceae bacterium]|nr:AbrB/MazE/SpoVT family DNA-binding domain-containing protein [Oscillospiraceae bacterium]